MLLLAVSQLMVRLDDVVGVAMLKFAMISERCIDIPLMMSWGWANACLCASVPGVGGGAQHPLRRPPCCPLPLHPATLYLAQLCHGGSSKPRAETMKNNKLNRVGHPAVHEAVAHASLRGPLQTRSFFTSPTGAGNALPVLGARQGTRGGRLARVCLVLIWPPFACWYLSFQCPCLWLRSCQTKR